jgi:hypothetical protein
MTVCVYAYMHICVYADVGCMTYDIGVSGCREEVWRGLRDISGYGGS